MKDVSEHCPDCGANLSIVGKAHRCPGPLSRNPIERGNQLAARKGAETKRVQKKLPPMEHPEDEPIVGGSLAELADKPGPKSKRNARAIPTPEAEALKKRTIERLQAAVNNPGRLRGKSLPDAHPDCKRCEEIRRRAKARMQSLRGGKK